MLHCLLNKQFTLASTCVEEDGLFVFLTFSDINDGDFVSLATSLSVLKTKSFAEILSHDKNHFL